MSQMLSRRTLVKAVGAAGSAGIVAATVSSAAQIAVADEGTSEGALAFVPGTYKASGTGHNGVVEVEVVLGEDAIESVAVVRQEETPQVAWCALRDVPAAIVDGQTLNVDVVSGSTMTSNAILDAVSQCVAAAGADPAALVEADQAPSTTQLAAGTYEARAHGHHSDVAVSVVLGDSSIESIEVTEEGETYNLADAALKTLPQKIVEAQSIGVDTVAGATFTSRALMAAVEECLNAAGGMEALRGYSQRIRDEVPAFDTQDLEADVVVVGSGMAGISAALSAQQAGARVVIVEKLPFWGGVSQTSEGWFVLPTGDDDAAVQQYMDNALLWQCGVMKGETADVHYPDLDVLGAFAANGYEAGQWIGTMGVDVDGLSDDYEPAYYRGSRYFVVGDAANPDLTGKAFETLIGKFVDDGGTIICDCAARELIVEDGRVAGVVAEGKGGSYRITSGAVVLAAGGFGANPVLVEEFAPAYAGEENVTLVGNVGDGIELGRSVGAAVYDDALMLGQFGHAVLDDHDMIAPYTNYKTPSSALFVNPQGLRVNSETPFSYTAGSSYVNPDSKDYYWTVTNATVASQPTNTTYAVGSLASVGNNAETEAAPTTYREIVESQIAAGNPNFITDDTLAGLAKKMRVTPNTLRYTLNRYNSFCEKGVDEDFDKDPENLIAMYQDEGPWYAAKCYMKYFGTIGGLKIDGAAEVLDEQGAPIAGLFAAGENANHGAFNVSYMDGRSMAFGLVMGRVAGKGAAVFALGA